MTLYEFVSALKEVGLICSTETGYEIGIREGYDVCDLLQEAYEILTDEEE